MVVVWGWVSLWFLSTPCIIILNMSPESFGWLLLKGYVVVLLFTNRYRDFKPFEGVPVRITFGAPRYRLPYRLEYKCSLLTPGRWFLQGTDEEFTRRYMGMLDGYGVERVRQALQQVCDSAGCGRLVFLCFDDVRKQLCHRMLFARWWEHKSSQRSRTHTHTRHHRQPAHDP